MSDKKDCFNCKFQPDWKDDESMYMTTSGICKWAEQNKIPACFEGGQFGKICFINIEGISGFDKLTTTVFRSEHSHHGRDPLDIYMRECKCWEEVSK